MDAIRNLDYITVEKMTLVFSPNLFSLHANIGRKFLFGKPLHLNRVICGCIPTEQYRLNLKVKIYIAPDLAR